VVKRACQETGTGRKRGPKGPRVDYEPALRAMVPLVLGGASVSEAARQVVDRGLVRVISAEGASARRLRALFANERRRLLLEYQRGRAAALSASMREFARTMGSIVPPPDAARAIEVFARSMAGVKSLAPPPDAARAIEAFARSMARVKSLAPPPDAVRAIEAFARSLEELRRRLLAAFPVKF
jgi:hypothetical protein